MSLWRKDRDEENDYVKNVMVPEFQRENPKISFKMSKLVLILSGSIRDSLYEGVEPAVSVVNDIFVMIDQYRLKVENFMMSQITKALAYLVVDENSTTSA